MKNIPVFKLFTIILALSILSIPISVYANNSKENESFFSDISENHWAYQAVIHMTNNKIINGYKDKTFKPNNKITRAEFSKIMVLAMNIQLVDPDYSSFVDIQTNHWANKYIESAKEYLTGYLIGNSNYFRPNRNAQREDMAVALVKALNISPSNDLSILDMFVDKNQISINLRPYVAAAVQNDIMKGYPIENSDLRYFKPTYPLTRAEASVLIFNSVNEVKVTYGDEEKIVIEPDSKSDVSDSLSTFSINAKTIAEGIKVTWTKPIKKDGFKYYKVVISKHNNNPKYPDDGYLYCISDFDDVDAIVNNSSKYNNGDFGNFLESGESYHFSITAVYNDEKLYTSPLKLVYP